MSELMAEIVEKKKKARKALAALPYEQKMAIVEKLRERNRMLGEARLRSRRNAEK